MTIDGWTPDFDAPLDWLHINNGTPDCSTKCAVAMAVTDAFHANFKAELRNVDVIADDIEIVWRYQDTGRYESENYTTSPALSAWIDLYDVARDQCLPITIVLNGGRAWIKDVDDKL